MPGHIDYPDSCKGFHYRISNTWRYVTVSFVLEKNLHYPELGFNFTTTDGQGIVHSNLLCFLTQSDADTFIEKYELNGYHSYLSRDTTSNLIKINRGGGIPCYTTRDCCEWYSNRISSKIQQRLEEEPVENPFYESDPNIQDQLQKLQKKEKKKTKQREILNQVFTSLPLTKQADNKYLLALNLSKNWIPYNLVLSVVETGSDVLLRIETEEHSHDHIIDRAFNFLPGEAYQKILNSMDKESRYSSNLPVFRSREFVEIYLDWYDPEVEGWEISWHSWSGYGNFMLHNYEANPYNSIKPSSRNDADKIVETVFKIKQMVENAAKVVETAWEKFQTKYNSFFETETIE